MNKHKTKTTETARLLALSVEAIELKREHDAAWIEANYHQYAVGRPTPICFYLLGEADTLSEAEAMRRKKRD